ncbi:uncharacterized protein TNCV_869441 [Trichonephila clavipes]|nr:uncharacterized protein TNCV_869441 [Trichonephila clavipes]
MTYCNQICCHLCNDSQEPFLNETMFGHTQQGCHKTVSVLLLPFLGQSDLQIYLQSSISEIIWDDELSIPEFERTRGKVTTNMERNVSRHHTELVCLNARSYHRGFNRVLNPRSFCLFL